MAMGLPMNAFHTLMIGVGGLPVRDGGGSCTRSGMKQPHRQAGRLTSEHAEKYQDLCFKLIRKSIRIWKRKAKMKRLLQGVGVHLWQQIN